MLGLTECTLTYTWWVVKWAVQSVDEDTGAAQVWAVFQFSVLRLGVSLDRWLFTTLFLEMQKRWRCYLTAAILAQLRVVLGDASSSSLCLIPHRVLTVPACSVSRLLFLLLLWGQMSASCPRSFVSMTTVFEVGFFSSLFLHTPAPALAPESYQARCLLLLLWDK